MGFYLGIDLGTSYFKAGVFDETGRLKGLGRQYVSKNTGDGTFCELPVALFWDTLSACVGEALQNAKIISDEILAVSYSSQANSFILLDDKDEPLTSLILWPDNRAEETDPPVWGLDNENEFLGKTGLGIAPNPQFAVAKINWFQKKQPKTWERVKSILFISDYLTLKITGQKICDVSTVSLTGLLDVKKCQWWDSALKSFSLNPSYLATPKRTGSYIGLLTETGAGLMGLSPGTPYYLGGLDHHCAAIGSGVLQNNNISESTGTVLSCVGYSHEYTPGAVYCTAPGLTTGHYFQMAFDDNGAVSLEWYRKNFASEYTIQEMLEMAKDVKNGSDGLVAKPCANKYQGLTGFENVKPFHKHGHFVRAILESTAVSLINLIDVVKPPSFNGGIVSTGGGARSNLWVAIKANRVNSEFFIPENNETACLGAAMIGAVGTCNLGFWYDVANNWVRYKEIVKPNQE